MNRGFTALATGCLVACCTAAHGQIEVFARSDRYFIEYGDTFTVTFVVRFPAEYYALSNLEIACVTSAGPAWIDRYALRSPMDGPGSAAGVLWGAGVDSILASQPHQPPDAPADPANPIEVWACVMTAQPLGAGRAPEVLVVNPYRPIVTLVRSVSSTETVIFSDLPESYIEVLAVDCLADINGDGSVDILDWLQYQEYFDQGRTYADLDADGALTVFDFLAFQNIFERGCP